MKQCRSCEKSLPLSDFYTNGWYHGKNGKTRKYKPTCRKCECVSERAAYNALIEGHFGGWICQECGFSGEPRQFDCHHRDPTEKDFRLSQYFRATTSSPERMKRELDKCDLLCANCHRLKH